MPKSDYGLTDSFGYWVNRLARSMREAVDRDFSKHGVNVAHWALLVALDSGESLRLADLARKSDLDPAGVTRLIEKLEAAGLVKKVPDSMDARAFRVSLSAKGRALLPVLKEISQRHNRSWLSNLSVLDADQLVRLIKQVAEQGRPPD